MPKRVVSSSLSDQVKILARTFSLEATHALKFTQNLPPLESFVPEEALLFTKYFAVLHVRGQGKDALSGLYYDTVRRVHGNIPSLITQETELLEYTKLSPATAHAYQALAQQQHGDIFIIAAQLGMYRRGLCPRDTCRALAENEFGLGALSVGSALLTKAVSFIGGVDCVGERIPSGIGFSRTCVPNYWTDDRGIRYRNFWEGEVNQYSGSATGFLFS